VARRAFRDALVGTLAFAYLFAIYAYIQPVGYRHAYPTLFSRIAFAHAFGNNVGLRLFYGFPFDLLTVGGYTAWRVGGVLAIAAAAFGVLAAVRPLRADEEAGRTELILAGIVGRRASYLAVMGAIAAGTAVLWVAMLVGFGVGGLAWSGSAYLALATVSVAPVFVGFGAVASQLAPTRRIALELGSAAVGLFLLLRVVADTASNLAWLRWLTPLGWAEEMRPFTGARPVVLILPVLATIGLLVAAERLFARRDIGTGVLPARDTADPRFGLLSSPAAQAFRTLRGGLTAWAASIALFALILGVVSKSVSSAGIPKNVERQLAKLGVGSILTPTGYLSFVFFFFVLALSLFVCAQVGSARREEEDERLETLLAMPVGRVGWLGGRLALAACGAAGLSLLAGAATWAGAAATGITISLADMLGAGANCLPVAFLFLGLAALAYAVAPRASGGIAYGIVIASFLWQAVGSLLGVPKWLVDLTPFAHLALVPAQTFRPTSAAIMIGIGLASGAAALAIFRRRDLLGA
jgi:ABC-2 type transport system permease protein